MSDPRSEARVAAVLESYLAAARAGRAPDRDALLAAHPGLEVPLKEALLGLAFVEDAGSVLALPDPGPPRVLGDFRIVAEVGRGGMGVVYEAEQVSLRRRVALKVLPFAGVLDPKHLQRFRNEAQAAAHLHHTNIVPVYAVGSERGVHYYAMQFIEGESLAQAIRDLRGEERGSGGSPISSHPSHREPAFLRMAAGIGMQAAEALDHAHQLGVVHRDIKPGNLLVDASGNLWITDFGLARLGGDAALTVTGDLVGTFRYMSPEQALAKRVPIDHRTDVYSLGATLYELITLEPAVRGEDPQAVLHEIAFQDPTPPRRINPAIPAQLETILLKAMWKDPAGRYATAQEMADDLRRFLENKPVLARRPSVATRLAKWSSRHRGLVAASFAVLLVGFVALAVGARNTSAALDRAETNLHFAHEAVDVFLFQLGIKGLEDETLPTEARVALLGKALQFYDKFLAEQEEPEAHVNRGHILRSLGRFEESLVACDRALEIDPNLAHAHGGRGNALQSLGRHEDALGAYDRAIEIDPNDANAHNGRGIALQSLGRSVEALAAHDKALAIEPGGAAAHSNRGNALQSLGCSDEAIEAYDRALKIDPRLANAHYNRGHSLLLLGRPNEALAAFDRTLEIEPDDAVTHLNRGVALGSLGRCDEALTACDRAIEIDAGFANAHCNRGSALLALGRHDEALVAYDRTLEIEPNDADVHYNRGNALLSLERFDEAIAAYDKALAIDPNYAKAHCNRGDTLQSLGRPEESLADYDRALKIDPNLVVAHCNRGNALLSAGRPDEALASYEHALKIDPNAAFAHSGRGDALRSLGRMNDAVAAYDKALAIDAGLADVHRYRGSALESLGHHADAIAAYDRAVALGDGKALNPLAWLLATAPDPSLRDAGRAVDAARKAAELAPQNGPVWNTLGVALFRAGSWAEALAAFEKSMEFRAGGDAYDWLFVAMAHWQLGHGDEASQWYGKAVTWTDTNGKDDEELLRFRNEAATLLGLE